MLKKAYYNATIGCLEIKGSSLGISSVKLVKKGQACPMETVPDILRDCVNQLDEYFQGRRREFSLELDWGAATAFNESVWKELLKIPFGHTTSYSAIAKKIGNPTAVRAVGMANRNNPIAIIVPCHRVIAKSGELQGYFYGLEIKRRLLELENPMSFARQGSLF